METGSKCILYKIHLCAITKIKEMSNKLFLTIHGTIYVTFGILLFAIPKLFWSMYGVELNDEYAVFLSQHATIFLCGIGFISLLFRDIEDKSIYAKKLFLGLVWTNLLGVAITLYACFDGIFYGLGWSDPAFFALMSILSFVRLKANR